MKITLLTVGKIKEKYFTMAIDEYKKRLGRYCKLEIIEVADEKTPDNASEHEEDIIRAKEGERLTKYIKDDNALMKMLHYITKPKQTIDNKEVLSIHKRYRGNIMKMTCPYIK